MSYEAKQALLSMPGTEIQGLQVQIFPGGTARSLLEELKKSPGLSAQINPDQLQVGMVDNGMHVVFEPEEDMYPTLKQGSVLELMSNRAPHLG